MDTQRFETLVEAYLEDSLSEAEARELFDVLRESPQETERFLEEIGFATYLSGQSVDRQDLRQRVLSGLRSGDDKRTFARNLLRRLPQKKGRSSWPVLWKSIAAVAAVLLLLGGYVWLAQNKGATFVAKVGLQKDGIVVRAGQRLNAVAGMPLRRNDVLESGGSGSLEFGYDGEQTSVQLRPGARLVLNGAGNAKRLELLQGQLEAAVDAQASGHCFVVVTHNAEATVVGTRFTLLATAAQTRLDVSAGAVHLTRRQDNVSIAVTAGHFAAVGGGSEFAALPIAPPVASEAAGLPPGARVLFQEAFVAGSSGWRGQVVPAPSSTPNDFAAQSVALEEAAKYPAFVGEIRSPVNDAGWNVGARTYLRFRYFTQSFTAQEHLKVMLKRKDLTNFAGRIALEPSGQWRTLTVRLDRRIVFDPDHTKTLAVGESVHALAWMVRSAIDAPPPGAKFWIDDVVVFESPIDVPSAELQEPE